MAYGVAVVLGNQSHSQQLVPQGAEYKTVAVLNPNDGVIFVARNRDCLGVAQGAWDWKVPSQSYALLPGPFFSVGLFYLDQSGAGHNGEINLYGVDKRVEIPTFQAIGRAIIAQQTALDVTQGTTPANPPTGISRIWIDNAGNLHVVDSTGDDDLYMSNETVLGGHLVGTLPNPSLAANSVATAQLQQPSVANVNIFDASINDAKISSNLVFPTSFTPNINQGATVVTTSVIHVSIGPLGTRKFLVYYVQFASAGANGGTIEIRVPSGVGTPAIQALAESMQGQFIYLQAATGIQWQGAAIWFDTLTIRCWWSGNNAARAYFGTSPSFQIASGDRLMVWMIYY